MGGLILVIVCLTALCVIMGQIPSMAAIKTIFMFVIGFLMVWGFFRLMDDFDGKL